MRICALVAIVTISVLLFTVIAVNAQEGTCENRRIEDATEECQHLGACTNGTCICKEGYDSLTCGWVNKASCDCLACLHGGNMTNPDKTDQEGYPHYCVCPSEWNGRNCDLCAGVETCRPLYPATSDPICDNTPIVIDYKVFDCLATDLPEEISFYNTSARFEIYREGLNVSQGYGFFQLWNFVKFEIREIFYCEIANCSAFGGEVNYQYTCQYTKCYSTGHLFLQDSFIRLIEQGITGLTEVDCFAVEENGRMQCTFFQEGLEFYIGKFSMSCQAGECSSSPRPIIEQPVNSTAIFVSSVSVVLIIVVVMISMYLYRRHQRKYFSFKGLDGKNIKFMDLADSGVQFANDVLTFDNIRYELDGKVLLNDVQGLALPGQVLAIIGASGAGKTTLLDILAQRVKRGRVSGSISVNGNPIDSSFIRITSYVDQEPAALGTQTVREMLMTAAQLRLPEVVTTQQKKERIQGLAFELGIEHILDRRYGETGNRGISGGEKRRVQIACQLVTGPSIVFLDEPTSGLDAFNALAVCRFLKRYASQKNRTIIMSIHQPRTDIFYSFDRLMVLGGGLVLYYGETQSAKLHFETMGYQCPPDFNPADFIMDVTMEEKEKLVYLHDQFLQSNFNMKLTREKNHFLNTSTPPRSRASSYMTDNSHHSYSHSHAKTKRIDEASINDASEPLIGSRDVIPEGYKQTYATSWFTQLGVLSGRSFADMYRYPLLLRMHLVFAVVSGLLIGILFFNLTFDLAGAQNRIGMLLFVLIVLSFGSMSSIGFMNRERELFTQERASGAYRSSAFFVVKLLFDLLPLRVLPAVVMGSLIYFLTGLQFETDLLAHFYLIIILFNCVTSLICLTISTIVRNTSLANLIAIIVLLSLLLFQNALINLDSLPIYISWITFISPFRFALNSLMVNEFDGLFFFIDGGTDPVPGRFVLSLFAFNPDWAYSIDIYALLAMMGFWFLLGFVCLLFFVREQR